MTPEIGLALVLAACCAFGAWRRFNDGRTRNDNQHGRLTPAEIGEQLGESATLLQFSTTFCAPCRTTRVVLSRTAEAVPGVAHVEVDAESNLDLVRRLDINRTPTTLLLDGAGRIRNRVVGVPQQDHLLAALAAID